MFVVIESISTNRMPGPDTIVFGYYIDEEEDLYRFCFEHDIHGWDFDNRTEFPDGWSSSDLASLILMKMDVILDVMGN